MADREVTGVIPCKLLNDDCGYEVRSAVDLVHEHTAVSELPVVDVHPHRAVRGEQVAHQTQMCLHHAEPGGAARSLVVLEPPFRVPWRSQICRLDPASILASVVQSTKCVLVAAMDEQVARHLISLRLWSGAGPRSRGRARTSAPQGHARSSAKADDGSRLIRVVMRQCRPSVLDAWRAEPVAAAVRP